MHAAEYMHPLHTPDFARAQVDIAAHQGRDKLWFAGSWTHDVDLQETALTSAIAVAEHLAPGSSNLERLRGRAAGSAGQLEPHTACAPTRQRLLS